MKPHVRDMNGELHLELPIAVQVPPAPPAQAAIATLDDIRRAANASLRWENHYIVSTRESWWWKRYGPAATPKEPDDYADWNKSIEGGKGYLVGESVPTETFLKTHRSSCKPWQQEVFEYCKVRPQEAVNLRNQRFDGARVLDLCQSANRVTANGIGMAFITDEQWNQFIDNRTPQRHNLIASYGILVNGFLDEVIHGIGNLFPSKQVMKRTHRDAPLSCPIFDRSMTTD